MRAVNCCVSEAHRLWPTDKWQLEAYCTTMFEVDCPSKLGDASIGMLGGESERSNEK